MQVRWIALLALVHTTLASIFPDSNLKNAVVNTTSVDDLNVTSSNNDTVNEARRRAAKKYRSTSSSSGEVGGRGGGSADSLGIEESSSDSSDSDEAGTKWTQDGQGWRKWHRKCNSCPDDMVKKWRDPSIKWICGGYQRARRTFKSECMMFYRNCQDGTMFTKIHDHRCNDKAPGYNGGRHFFYDYRVRLLEESSSSGASDTESSASSDSDSDSKSAV